MNLLKIALSTIVLFFYVSIGSLYASVSKINFLEFDFFKDTIQSNIIGTNQLSEITSADLDFVRANQKQLKIIRKKINFTSFNEEQFINSYKELNETFTQLSFDIYRESKFFKFN